MSEPSHEKEVEAILHAYLQAVDAGQKPDRDELLRQHPHLAAELREFFADERKLARFAQSLHKAQVGDATVGAAETAKALPRLRYFGDYELVEEIGRGGMGVVYKARQVSLNRIVGLKMILAGQLANDGDVRRFHAEAEAAAKLDHPGIVPVFEVGQHDGHHYFSMAFVEGESLAHQIVQGVFPPRQAAELTRKVAEAVAYAHVEGVIHRDLKPANILIDRHGQPRLTDFGLAKRLQSVPQSAAGATAAAGLTATGQILGTPSYMPPEQASGAGDAVGPLADVYSLGAVLYCLLTGRPPFQSDNPLDTLLQVVQREPVAPRQLNAAVPRDLETICLKCLAKEPSRRYASAQELAADLERFLAGQPIHARPISVAERAWRWCRRKPALAAASALAASLAVAFAVYHFRAADHNQRLLAESYLDKGQTLCEQGDTARGMLWFARSLETAPGNARDLQRTIRANLGAWHVPGARLRMVLTPAHNVTAVAISPDGTTVLTATTNEVQRWNVATGMLIGEPSHFIGHQNSASFSPDGTRFAVGSYEQGVTAMLWDTVAGKPIRRFPRPVDLPKDGPSVSQARKTVFSPDGKTLVTTDYSTVQLWDVASGKLVGATLRGADGKGLHKDWIEALALSPDGKILATGARDNTARLWDTATGKPLGEPLAHESWVRSVAFSPDGKTLLTGAFGGAARFWDVASGKLIGTPLTHRGFIYVVAFSPDGRIAMTGAGNVTGGDGEHSARLWDVATHRPIGMALQHNGYVEAVAFSPDGKSVVTTGGGDACLWDLPESQPPEMILRHDGPVVSVAFSPDGSLVATACDRTKAADWKGEVRFWEANTGKPLGDAVPIPMGLSKVVFSPDGKILAAAIDAGYRRTPGKQGQSEPAWDVRLVDVASRRLIGGPLELWGQIGDVSFGPDSTTVITTDFSEQWNDRKGMIRTWDVATGRVIGEPEPLPHMWQKPNPGYRRADGTRILMGGGGDSILVFTDVARNQVIGLIQSPGGTGPAAISPDGTLLVTAGGRAQQLWDLYTHKPIGPPRDPVAAVAFSPDGKTILTGSRDGTARLRPLPPTVEGKVNRVVLWVEVLTGSALDRSYPARQVLRPQDLHKRQQQLDKLGGPPLP